MKSLSKERSLQTRALPVVGLNAILKNGKSFAWTASTNSKLYWNTAASKEQHRKTPQRGTHKQRLHNKCYLAKEYFKTVHVLVHLIDSDSDTPAATQFS